MINMSKTEIVRVELNGEDFVNFNNLVSRITFSEKMNTRKEKELTAKTAIMITQKLVDSIVKNHKLSFVSSDPDQIITLGTTSEIDYKKKFEDLRESIINATPHETENGIDLPSNQWQSILNHSEFTPPTIE